MVDARGSNYKQGDFLTEECAQVACPKIDGEQVSGWIIATHDCDMFAHYSKEPWVEVIPFRVVPALIKDHARAKNARTLTIEIIENGRETVIELRAVDKTPIDKRLVAQFSPDSNRFLAPSNRNTFQSWLASRYRRSAFSEAFNNALKAGKEKQKKDFPKRIEVLMSKYSVAVRSLLFRVEDDEREDAKDTPFRLGIYVLYSLRDTCADADVQGKACAAELDELFADSFCSDLGWSWIEVEYCDAISDMSFTVAEHDEYRQWSLEFLSHIEDGDHAMPFTET